MSTELHADNGDTVEAGRSVPSDIAIIIPVRNMTTFPGAIAPLGIGRPASIAAAEEAVRLGRPVGLVQQRDPATERPTGDQLHLVGTEAKVLRHVVAPDGTHHVICQGQHRIRIVEFVEGYPFLAARFVRIGQREVMTPELEARVEHLRREASEAAGLLPSVPDEFVAGIRGITNAGALADLVAQYIDFKPQEKQEILEIFDPAQRVARVSELLAHRLAVLRLTQEMQEQTKEQVDRKQREYLLREQLKAIQHELGEDETGESDLGELRQAIENAGMPEEAAAQARKELARLERMPESAAEHAMVRTYLDWMAELPWSRLEEKEVDIGEARTILDEDHYGLAKVKRRILEYLAVRKLNPKGRSPILCLVGPPGVGKTSLGRSIARATGRRFVRAALGGLHDESEIRGHRRTYIGAMPGNIIQSIRKAGAADPVFMLDEVDKIGVGFHGDPSAALLEVLDPEQNATFRDNYLAVPFDLSKVMFISTANRTDTIPPALLDRMELIEIPGYTEDEKLEIARRYLVARQLEANGLGGEQCSITDEALRAIIREYTRESGCRQLEREIGGVFRFAAMRIAEQAAGSLHVDRGDIPEILGAPRFENDVAMRVSVPGVATGLAWTPVGGDILFIEATRVPGNGKLILTGQLGDVMKESAQAALTLVKNRASGFGLEPETFEKSDIHMHVPAGAIPKDGPSAGVAMFIALVSQLTGRTVRSDTAMTGEISLRGLVLPIGGFKEKAVAAARAGITRVLAPRRNRKDLEEIPESARKLLEFVWLDDVDAAMEAAFGGNDSAVAA
ncbi:MAG: endopeptidase La [Arenicellales bacterium]